MYQVSLHFQFIEHLLPQGSILKNESHDPSNQTETNDLEKHRDGLNKEWDELLKRNLSNTENLAKYVFSLSSAGLGVSMIVVKDMNLLTSGRYIWILIVSWIAFSITISSALISYLTSLYGIDKEFDRIEEEYNKEAGELGEDEIKRPGRATKILRYVFVISCIIGILCTPLFICLNYLFC